MGPRSTRWGTGIWFLLCTGLAGGVALELLQPLAPQVTAARPAAPLPEFAPEPGEFEPPPRHVFAEIVARPLFSASRRPFAESESAAEAPGEAVPIELVGTLLTEKGAAALLQPQGQNARWLHAGDTIAGWQVATIQRDQVNLHLDGEAKTLELRADLDQPAQTPPKKPERRRAGRMHSPPSKLRRKIRTNSPRIKIGRKIRRDSPTQLRAAKLKKPSRTPNSRRTARSVPGSSRSAAYPGRNGLPVSWPMLITGLSLDQSLATAP